jgi:SEC-C motif domain protein
VEPAIVSKPSCACGHPRAYEACCGRFIEGGEIPETAEQLMRSRYTAYTLRREPYLLATWHASTRPKALRLSEDDDMRWLGLDVKRHASGASDTETAIVEFVARFKIGGGRAERLREVSRFVRETGRWFYVDGETDQEGANARKHLRQS